MIKALEYKISEFRKIDINTYPCNGEDLGVPVSQLLLDNDELEGMETPSGDPKFNSS